MVKPLLSRRSFLVCGSSVAVCALAGRVWWVNNRKYPYPYETVHHATGEWVDLDGAFISDATEGTQGYSVRVVNAELLSHDEYIGLYAADSTQVEDIMMGLNDKSVVCLTLELRNDAAVEGGFIFLGEARLIGDGLPLKYSYDPVLWAASNPNITDMSYYIGVVPGTVTTQHVPYSLIHSQEDNGRYTEPLPTVSSYEFVVSNAPVRHVIDIDLSRAGR